MAEWGFCFQRLCIQHLTPSQRSTGLGLAVYKHGTLSCSLPACLQGGIGFSASEKASQLLKSLICDDKEGTED